MLDGLVTLNHIFLEIEIWLSILSNQVGLIVFEVKKIQTQVVPFEVKALSFEV